MEKKRTLDKPYNVILLSLISLKSSYAWGIFFIDSIIYNNQKIPLLNWYNLS